jgi:hypothetical protein
LRPTFKTEEIKSRGVRGWKRIDCRKGKVRSAVRTQDTLHTAHAHTQKYTEKYNQTSPVSAGAAGGLAYGRGGVNGMA